MFVFFSFSLNVVWCLCRTTQQGIALSLLAPSFYIPPSPSASPSPPPTLRHKSLVLRTCQGTSISKLVYICNNRSAIFCQKVFSFVFASQKIMPFLGRSSFKEDNASVNWGKTVTSTIGKIKGTKLGGFGSLLSLSPPQSVCVTAPNKRRILFGSGEEERMRKQQVN